MHPISQRGDLVVDAWLEQFIRTTVGFAVWHAPERVEAVRVRLWRQPFGEVVCEMTAEQGNGERVSRRGAGRETFEAIQLAADRLEVALFGPTPGAHLAALPAHEAA